MLPQFHPPPSPLHRSNGQHPEFVFVTPMLKDYFKFESITIYIYFTQT